MGVPVTLQANAIEIWVPIVWRRDALAGLSFTNRMEPLSVVRTVATISARIVNGKPIGPVEHLRRRDIEGALFEVRPRFYVDEVPSDRLSP